MHSPWQSAPSVLRSQASFAPGAGRCPLTLGSQSWKIQNMLRKLFKYQFFLLQNLHILNNSTCKDYNFRWLFFSNKMFKCSNDLKFKNKWGISPGFFLIVCRILFISLNVFDTYKRKPRLCKRTIENRIYREELTRKKCKTAILLFPYCRCTSHIYVI